MLTEATFSLIGHVGSNPEIRATGNGKKMARLSIATNERWTDQQQQRQERTHWHNPVTFSPKLVEVIERYVTKGAYIRLTGKLQPNQFERGGETHYTVDLVITRLDFLEAKDAGSYSAED